MWILWIMLTPWLFIIKKYINGKLYKTWKCDHGAGGHF